jgi:hypothetical protein
MLHHKSRDAYRVLHTVTVLLRWEQSVVLVTSDTWTTGKNKQKDGKMHNKTPREVRPSSLVDSHQHLKPAAHRG